MGSPLMDRLARGVETAKKKHELLLAVMRRDSHQLAICLLNLCTCSPGCLVRHCFVKALKVHFPYLVLNNGD